MVLSDSRRFTRLASLVALCLNYTLITVLVHISRARIDPSIPRYRPMSAVVLTEVGKFLVSCFLAMLEIGKKDLKAAQDPDLLASSEKHSRTTSRTAVDLPFLVNKEADDVEAKLLGDAHLLAKPPKLPIHALRQLVREVFGHDWYKLGLPAALFTLQANLAYIGLANLSVPEFHILSRFKILTTAFFSIVILKRSYSRTQWMALGLLGLGVALVSLQANIEDYRSRSTASRHTTERHMNQFLGLVAVVASSISSGFASVYFEFQLKSNPAQPIAQLSSGTSTALGGLTHSIDLSHASRTQPPIQVGLWVRNVQLSLFSMAIGIVGFAVDANKTGGSLTPPYVSATFFVGFTPLVWTIIGLQVFGGLVTALVMKYADNIAKIFSTSISLILSFVASVWLFDYSFGAAVLVGTASVVVSTYLYAA